MPAAPSPKLLHDLYWGRRLTLREVAEVIGLNYSPTRRLFLEHEIPLRSRGGGIVPGTTSDLDGAEIVRLHGRGLSMRALGKVAGVHHTTIRRVLEARGVIAPLPRRNRAR